ncbi:MAG: type II toxin-antitoxin system Phd/YefM family antitoxin [Vicinamibacterales bacterium]
MKLGLRDANRHFSKAIRAVRAGKEVILTERGQPIAVIKPIKEARQPETALKRVADKGLITLPTGKGPLPRFEPIRMTGALISEMIIEDRDDRARRGDGLRVFREKCAHRALPTPTRDSLRK